MAVVSCPALQIVELANPRVSVVCACVRACVCVCVSVCVWAITIQKEIIQNVEQFNIIFTFLVITPALTRPLIEFDRLILP